MTSHPRASYLPLTVIPTLPQLRKSRAGEFLAGTFKRARMTVIKGRTVSDGLVTVEPEYNRNSH